MKVQKKVRRFKTYEIQVTFENDEHDLTFSKKSGRKRRIDMVQVSLQTTPGVSPLSNGPIYYTVLGHNILISGRDGTAFSMNRYSVPADIDDFIQRILRRTLVKMYNAERGRK